MDDLAVFETASHTGPAAPARYAIRQALDQEYQKYLVKQNAAARLARYKAGGKPGDDEEINNDDREDSGAAVADEVSKAAKPLAAKRDFFGRIINEARPPSKDGSTEGDSSEQQESGEEEKGRKVWVSFHEGFSNAVRKPITLEELMRGF